MIVEVVNNKFGVRYTPKYMATLLNSIGLSYQKAKFESDKLDEEEHKRKRREWDTRTWPEILTQAESLGAVILFGDEVSFAQWGSLSRTWAPKGKQPVVKTKGKRKGMKVFGAIEFHGGGFHYEECDGRFNGESYARFLGHVLKKYDQQFPLQPDSFTQQSIPLFFIRHIFLPTTAHLSVQRQATKFNNYIFCTLKIT